MRDAKHYREERERERERERSMGEEADRIEEQGCRKDEREVGAVKCEAERGEETSKRGGPQR